MFTTSGARWARLPSLLPSHPALQSNQKHGGAGVVLAGCTGGGGLSSSSSTARASLSAQQGIHPGLKRGESPVLLPQLPGASTATSATEAAMNQTPHRCGSWSLAPAARLVHGCIRRRCPSHPPLRPIQHRARRWSGRRPTHRQAERGRGGAGRRRCRPGLGCRRAGAPVDHGGNGRNDRDLPGPSALHLLAKSLDLEAPTQP